jgi:hypothetical protein
MNNALDFGFIIHGYNRVLLLPICLSLFLYHIMAVFYRFFDLHGMDHGALVHIPVSIRLLFESSWLLDLREQFISLGVWLIKEISGDRGSISGMIRLQRG